MQSGFLYNYGSMILQFFDQLTILASIFTEKGLFTK